VIAIIALLVSILMPSLKQAKEQAKLVICQSNLRHQGLCCQFYLEDYDQQFPTIGDSITTYKMGWGGKQGEEYTQQQHLLLPYVDRLSDVDTETTGMVELFKCPSDAGSYGAGWPGDRLPTHWDVLGRGYHYNASAIDNDGSRGLWSKKTDDVKRPDHVILAGDGTLMTYFWNLNPFVRAYWHDKKELGWTNALFVDSHVQYIQMTFANPDFQHGDGWTVVYND